MNTAAYYNSQPVDDYIRELSLREREVTRSRGIDNFKKEVPYKILLFLGYTVGICLLLWFLFNGLQKLLVRYNIIQEVPYVESTIASSPYEPKSSDEDRLIDMERFLPNGYDTDEPIIDDGNANNDSYPGGSSSQSSDDIERPIRNTRSSDSGSSSSGGSGSDLGSGSGGGSGSIVGSGSCSGENLETASGVPSPQSQVETQNVSETEINEVDKPRRGAVRNYVIFDTSSFDGEYISHLIVGRKYENPESESSSQWCYTELSYESGLVKTLYLVNTNENGILETTEITHEIANKFGVPISEIHRAQRSCSI